MRLSKVVFGIVFWLACVSMSLAATLLPNGMQTFIDANGAPLGGGSVYFYVPGTTTPKTTWQDSTQVTANTNPITLDSAGRAIIYGSGVYRERVFDSLGNLIWDQLTSDTSTTPAIGYYYAGLSTGSANAQLLASTTPSGFFLTGKPMLVFTAGFTNTGPATVTVSGTSTLSVYKQTQGGIVPLAGGEISQNQLTVLIYNGTYYELISNNNYLLGSVQTLASATTTDLGTTATHTVQITGNTTITSLGSTANVNLPLYFISFNGALTLTYNATSLITPGAANITTAAGDNAIALYLGSGNWQIISYTTASGYPIFYNPNPITAVRQTVQTGPKTGVGLASFLPATSASLSITSQNISTGSARLVVDAAAGWGTQGPIDVVGVSTTNLTWGSLTTAVTNYLGVTIANGALTPFSTTTIPIYQYGGTVSVTNGQYTFDISQMQMFLGNGSTASAVNAVFVGEAVAGASTITSTVAYAYNGYYDSGFTATLPSTGTLTTVNDNIGVKDQIVTLIIENTSTDDGYAVGDRLQVLSSQASSTVYFAIALGNTRNTAFFTPGNTNAFVQGNKSSGVATSFTLNKWQYKVIAQRSF